MMKKALYCTLLLTMLALTATAYQVRPRKQRVYMFGFAASLTDSIAYITDLQAVDGYVMPNGFLADRSLYSLQLNNNLAVRKGRENMTCVVFFHAKKAKAEKKFQKVRKNYRKSHPEVILENLGVDQFHFENEEWVDTHVEEIPAGKE